MVYIDHVNYMVWKNFERLWLVETYQPRAGGDLNSPSEGIVWYRNNKKK